MTPTWFMAIPFALMPLIFHWMPVWRRNGIWFGVTVAQDYPMSQVGRATLRDFRVAVWLLGLAAVAIALLAPFAAWTFPIAMTLEIVGMFGAMVVARQRTLPHAVRPTATRSVSLLEPPETMPFGLAAPLVPLAILGAAGAYCYVSGIWREASAALVSGAVQTAVMLFMGFAILRHSPRARVAANAAATIQFRRVLVEYMIVAAWVMAALLAAMAIAPGLPPAIFGLLFPALAILYVWRLIRLGRGSGGGGDGTPDECWKLGMFYFNPEDPAIFVEQRFGIGYTLNWANRATWMFGGIMVALTLIAPLLMRYL
ncbi:MAG: DUF5808 domain-containing protein [Candidatus Solibacter sp.]